MEMHVFQNLSSLIEREIDLDRLLSTLGRFVAQRVGSERATIWLIDAESKTLQPSGELTRTRRIGAHARAWPRRSVCSEQDVIYCRCAIRHRLESRYRPGNRVSHQECVLCADSHWRWRALGVIQALNLDVKLTKSETIKRLEWIAKELSEAFDYTSLRPDGDRHGVKVRGRFNHIVGSSAAMNDVYSLITRAAAVDATVLLRGETGTGKGLFARAIHVNSPRSQKNYVYVDCTTLPASLVESELFGHEKGSFTGADRQSPGKVNRRGTYSSMKSVSFPSPSGKLLRFVQDREFERVGVVKH